EQEKEETMRELEHLTRAMSREGWEELRSKTGTTGYHFDQINVVPNEDWWTPEISQAAKQGKLVTVSKDGQTVVAPLSVRGEVIGTLGVLDDPDNPLAQEDLALLEAVSEEIAQAMESARLFEDAQLRAEEMAVLNELAQTLSTRLMVSEVLEASYQGASRLLDTTNFYIAFYDPETEIISFPLNIESKQRVNLPPRQKGKGITEYILNTQEPLLLQEKLEQRLEELGIEAIGQLALSWLGVPLIAGDRILGAMAVQSYTTPRLYNEHDQNMLSAIANQLAIAVQNALLFEETQTALSESEILYEVAQNLGQMDEEQTMFEFVLPKYLNYLKFAQGGILIMNADGTTGTLKALIREGQPAETGLQIPLTDNWPMEKMLETKKSVTITDARHHENQAVRKLAKELNYKSLMLVPIIIRNEVVGTLGADAIEATHEFTEREIALVQAIANQLAIAIANLRSLEEAKSALDEVEATQRLYLREEWKKFVPDQVAPFYERVQEGLPPLKDTEKTLLIEKTLLEPSEGTETKLVVPLLLRGETIGALGLEKAKGTQTWTEEEMALVETVAEQLAIAVESARLLEETQNRAARERLTGEITSRLRETLNVDSVIRTAANEIYEAIDLEHVTVRLTEEATLSKKEAEA
ncbi:MAG: GAF domain-containing protein, partial [Chloroflexota bacterium]|nr:GAF domain-containing protein [Chloroflexota bacterium]